MPRLTSSIINNHVSADPEPWLLKAVTDHFWDQYLAAGKDTKEFAVPGTRWRASWAGKCARAIAYNVAGIPESDPITVANADTLEFRNLNMSSATSMVVTVTDATTATSIGG